MTPNLASHASSKRTNQGSKKDQVSSQAFKLKSGKPSTQSSVKHTPKRLESSMAFEYTETIHDVDRVEQKKALARHSRRQSSLSSEMFKRGRVNLLTNETHSSNMDRRQQTFERVQDISGMNVQGAITEDTQMLMAPSLLSYRSNGSFGTRSAMIEPLSVRPAHGFGVGAEGHGHGNSHVQIQNFLQSYHKDSKSTNQGNNYSG